LRRRPRAPPTGPFAPATIAESAVNPTKKPRRPVPSCPRAPCLAVQPHEKPRLPGQGRDEHHAYGRAAESGICPSGGLSTLVSCRPRTQIQVSLQNSQTRWRRAERVSPVPAPPRKRNRTLTLQAESPSDPRTVQARKVTSQDWPVPARTSINGSRKGRTTKNHPAFLKTGVPPTWAPSRRAPPGFARTPLWRGAPENKHCSSHQLAESTQTSDRLRVAVLCPSYQTARTEPTKTPLLRILGPAVGALGGLFVGRRRPARDGLDFGRNDFFRLKKTFFPLVSAAALQPPHGRGSFFRIHSLPLELLLFPRSSNVSLFVAPRNSFAGLFCRFFSPVLDFPLSRSPFDVVLAVGPFFHRGSVSFGRLCGGGFPALPLWASAVRRTLAPKKTPHHAPPARRRLSRQSAAASATNPLALTVSPPGSSIERNPIRLPRTWGKFVDVLPGSLAAQPQKRSWFVALEPPNCRRDPPSTAAAGAPWRTSFEAHRPSPRSR